MGNIYLKAAVRNWENVAGLPLLTILIKCQALENNFYSQDYRAAGEAPPFWEIKVRLQGFAMGWGKACGHHSE